MKTTMREKMSTVINKGFMMRFKAVTDIMFTIVGSNLKTNRTAIAEP